MDESHRWAIDPAKLESYVLEAVRGQRLEEDRATLLEAVAAGEVDVYAPDDDGYRTVAVAGHKLLRLHHTRLLPDHPVSGN